MIDPAKAIDRYLLLDYTWYPALGGPLRTSLGNFSSAAYRFDREAGFTSIAVPEDGDTASPVGHLVVHVTEDSGAFAGERRLAAYLTVEGIDSTQVAEARFVVAPDLRSRGIATLLVEKLQAERAEHGWFGLTTGRVRMIAAGTHPASLRLADRFGFGVTGERWLLLAALGRSRNVSDVGRGGVEVIESVFPAHVRNGVVHPVAASAEADGRVLIERRYFGTGANPDSGLVVRHSVDGQGKPDATAGLLCGPDIERMTERDIDALFDVALADLTARGASSVVADVDPADINVIRVARRKNFHHDQSNVIVEVELES